MFTVVRERNLSASLSLCEASELASRHVAASQRAEAPCHATRVTNSSTVGVMLMNPRWPGTSNQRCSVSDFTTMVFLLRTLLERRKRKHVACDQWCWLVAIRDSRIARNCAPISQREADLNYGNCASQREAIRQKRDSLGVARTRNTTPGRRKFRLRLEAISESRIACFDYLWFARSGSAGEDPGVA